MSNVFYYVLTPQVSIVLPEGPTSQAPRIATHERLLSEVVAWERQRNVSAARIKWMFTTDNARTKMGRAYPQPVGEKTPSLKES